MQIAESLPVLSAAATPAQALRAMLDAGRSAVVVKGADENSLVLGGLVATAWKNGVPSLRMVGGSEPVAILTPQVSAKYSLDLDDPFTTESEYRIFFDAVVPNYAIPNEPDDRSGRLNVRIITASEMMLASLTMLGAYICDGPSRHTFPDPPVTNGQVCPLCPSSAHATVALVAP
jgi:hypothetical protein